jgi:hypothetical protein
MTRWSHGSKGNLEPTDDDDEESVRYDRFPIRLLVPYLNLLHLSLTFDFDTLFLVIVSTNRTKRILASVTFTISVLQILTSSLKLADLVTAVDFSLAVCLDTLRELTLLKWDAQSWEQDCYAKYWFTGLLEPTIYETSV